MTTDDLLFPAMIVFGLLIIGLVLTVIEFKNLQSKDKKNKE
jgi:hypothetical protein